MDGFDLRLGLTTFNLLEARVNRAMVNASTLLVAVCDATKLHRRSMAPIVPPKRTTASLLITPWQQRIAMRSSQIEVNTCLRAVPATVTTQVSRRPAQRWWKTAKSAASDAQEEFALKHPVKHQPIGQHHRNS
jgi:hypothetical protein